MDVDVLIMRGLWHCGASKNYHQRQNLTDELLGLLHNPQLIPSCGKPNSFPLVMTNIAMENHHFEWENSL
jgi:hypothetical protein